MLGVHSENPADTYLDDNLTLAGSWNLAISLSPGLAIGDFHQV
jgi:hypothetical protein